MIFIDAKSTQTLHRKDILGKEYQNADDKTQLEMLRDASNISTALYHTILNDGVMPDGRLTSFSDVVTSTTLMRFFPISVEMILRGEIEPQTPITEYVFDKMMSYSEGRQVVIGAVGAIDVKEVAEGGKYEEIIPDLDGGDQVSAQIKKYGRKIGITLEGKERDAWGIMRIFLTKIGNAFARNREKVNTNMLMHYGTVVFDNDISATSVEGNTTGRGIDGGQNGTLTYNDMMRTHIYMMLRNFNLDMIIMHPFAWETWMTDYELKEIAKSGSNVLTTRPPSGSPAPGWPDPFGGMGVNTTGTGNSTLSGDLKMGAYGYTNNLNPWGSTFNIAPEAGIPGLRQIIVSPFVPIRQNSSGKFVTDIIFVDSQQVGVHITREAPTSEEWEDVETEMSWLKVRERWGTAIYNQGKAIGICKNVVVDRNYVFENVNQVSLSPLSGNVDMSSILS